MSTSTMNNKISSEKPILFFAKRPFEISSPGRNSTNFIDEEMFIKLKMNHETICYVDQKIKGELKKIVGSCTVTTHLVKNGQLSKSLRFHAKIVRNLGFDAQANDKLWKKCGMSISSDSKVEDLSPKVEDMSPDSSEIKTENPPHETEAKIEKNEHLKSLTPKIQPDIFYDDFMENDNHDEHYCIHGSACHDRLGCNCSFPCEENEEEDDYSENEGLVQKKEDESFFNHEDYDPYDDFIEIYEDNCENDESYEDNINNDDESNENNYECIDEQSLNQSDVLYQEIDLFTSEYDPFDELLKDKQHCPGCIFLNSRSIASQWLESGNKYTPRLVLPYQHLAAQCPMKDVVMNLVYQSNMNVRFYSKQDYIYEQFPIPPICCDHFLGS